MGNLDFSANADQLKELATYMASQINVPTIGIGGGYAPIGSINFFDATVAPQDWLACDGSVYNIADYPQLADWYEAQHGSKNFYGGDGTTTFAVPDLQGEFLRGTGTNSHANQGSGANVGEHQDGTIHTITDGDGSYNANQTRAIYPTNSSINPDSIVDTVKGVVSSSVDKNNTLGTSITSRPTNTSFLICVKAVVAGEVYSTEERVVGTWIDGKPVYRKTIQTTIPTTDGTYHGKNNIDISSLNVNKLIDTEISYISDATIVGAGGLFVYDANAKVEAYIYNFPPLSLVVTSNMPTCNGKTIYVTIRYTKTTD